MFSVIKLHLPGLLWSVIIPLSIKGPFICMCNVCIQVCMSAGQCLCMYIETAGSLCVLQGKKHAQKVKLFFQMQKDKDKNNAKNEQSNFRVNKAHFT